MMDSDEHYGDGELCISKSFSLQRKLVVGVRTRAAYLSISMSAYVSALIRNDLARGIQAPFQLAPGEELRHCEHDNSPQAPRGGEVVFDLPEG